MSDALSASSHARGESDPYRNSTSCADQILSLYCSSECRMQDKGTQVEPIKSFAPIRFTARMPDSLSPLVRPVHHISPSPKMPPQTDTSSASSSSSSPLHSPRTNPSASDSPQRELFDLPPPAFPSQSLAFPGSIPVKIPALLPRTRSNQSPAIVPQQTLPNHGSIGYPIGTSMETLRFGRKPSMTNSVISPNALLPRCACGKPANHKGRSSSKERNVDLDFHHLSLGPSAVHQAHGERRHVSDGQATLDRNAISGHVTPTLMLSSSYLSRSRSDPAPSSPKHRAAPRPNNIAPMTSREQSVISPSRRASTNNAPMMGSSGLSLSRNNSTRNTQRTPAQSSPVPPPVSENRESRGRSRERVVSALPPNEDNANFNHPPDRSFAPSRSRSRFEAIDKDRRRMNKSHEHSSRERDRTSPIITGQANSARVTP